MIHIGVHDAHTLEVESVLTHGHDHVLARPKPPLHRLLTASHTQSTVSDLHLWRFACMGLSSKVDVLKLSQTCSNCYIPQDRFLIASVQLYFLQNTITKITSV